MWGFRQGVYSFSLKDASFRFGNRVPSQAKILGNCKIHCCEFHQWLLHFNNHQGGAYCPYSLVPDPQISRNCETFSVLGGSILFIIKNTNSRQCISVYLIVENALASPHPPSSNAPRSHMHITYTPHPPHAHAPHDHMHSGSLVSCASDQVLCLPLALLCVLPSQPSVGEA